MSCGTVCEKHDTTKILVSTDAYDNCIESIDVGGAAMVITTHSIHCGNTSGSHELPPTAAEGELYIDLARSTLSL